MVSFKAVDPKTDLTTYGEEIKAKRGIDLSPYSNSTEELELLLDHQTTLRIMAVIETPERLTIKCEQV